MTPADDSVYRLGKLCNPAPINRRESVRWLRGRVYHTERKIERLVHAWPDEARRTADQVAMIGYLEGELVACREALAHHAELLARETPALTPVDLTEAAEVDGP